MSTAPGTPERYTIVLQAMPSDAPAIIRLRRFLKAALRSYRFRCIGCEALQADVPAQEQNDILEART
jgi:hypothetical protein